MGQIKIYPAEEGLKLTDTVSYSTAINFSKDEKRLNKAIAAIESNADITQPELAYFETILVSTGWNKNTDVFLPSEIWSARATAKNKRVNLNHDDKLVVGHIIDSFAVDDDFKTLEVSESEIPDVFHILSSCVIYKAWTDAEILERVKKVLTSIARGEMYVSVEAMFNDFDYALISNSSNKEYIIKRDEESAFLTKHLTFYGGKGEYKGYKVGRVLRNISFNGKALTETPANEKSVVLNETVRFNGGMISLSEFESPKTTKVILVNNENQEYKMETDAKVLLSQIEDLKTANASLKKERDDAQNKATEAASLHTKAEIDGLKADVAKKDQSVSELNSKVCDLNLKLTEAGAAKEKAEKTLAELTKEVDGLKLNLVKNERIGLLVAAGMQESDAKVKVEKFISLNDEQFAEIVTLAKAAKIDTTQSTSTSQVLNTVEKKNETVPQTETDKAEQAVASLAKYVSKFFVSAKNYSASNS